jgi:hypothetical protein
VGSTSPLLPSVACKGWQRRCQRRRVRECELGIEDAIARCLLRANPPGLSETTTLPAGDPRGLWLPTIRTRVHLLLNAVKNAQAKQEGSGRAPGASRSGGRCRPGPEGRLTSEVYGCSKEVTRWQPLGDDGNSAFLVKFAQYTFGIGSLWILRIQCSSNSTSVLGELLPDQGPHVRMERIAPYPLHLRFLKEGIHSHLCLGLR